MSNENQILPTPALNSNESPDLPAPPAKSGKILNLEIKGVPPSPGTPTRAGAARGGGVAMAAAHAAARCEHVKSNGVRCGSPALRDQIYCYFHHIWRNHQNDRQPFYPDPNGMLWNLPLLEDADDIQMAIQLVLNSVLCNKLELKRASILLYGLQTAAANVRRTHFDWSAYRKDLSTELK